jgi:hypothetical protein
VKRTSIIMTIILAICIGTSCALAGEMELGAGTKQIVFSYSMLTNEGMSALSSFRINYFDLGSSPYRGGLAFRYFVTDGMAIRPGFWIGYNAPTLEIDMEGAEGGEMTDTELGFSLVLEKYLTPLHRISPYLGVGGGFNYGKIDLDGPLPDAEGNVEASWKSTEIHAFCVGGFQFFATERVGLGCEVSFGYIRFSIDEEFPEMPILAYSGNTFGFIGGSLFVSIGL